MTKIVLKGGQVVDESGIRRLDVTLDPGSGLVTSLEADASTADDVEVVDIAGCYLSPGFVDLHAHLGEPGDEAAETILSASRAAALGGYSAVVAMPDTNPNGDSAPVISLVGAIARDALCLVQPAGAVSHELDGATLAPMSEMANLGVGLFSDCGSGIQNAGFLRQAMNYVADLRTPTGHQCRIAQRCDLLSLSAGGQMHEGEWSSRLGLPGSPAEAEQIMVSQVIAVAAMTGSSIHLQHLSTARSFELVRAAKATGVPVTADVSPHHLALSDAACRSYDANFKVNPPLRPESDVLAARAALVDGTVDAVATGHAPHSPDTKERPFDQASVGVLGLETALAVLLDTTTLDGAALVGAALDGTGLDGAALDVETVVACMSTRPAKIAGLSHLVAARIEPGAIANLTVIDPDKTWICDPAKLASRASNTPFAGRTFTAKIRHTLLNGEFVVRNFEATR